MGSIIQRQNTSLEEVEVSGCSINRVGEARGMWAGSSQRTMEKQTKIRMRKLYTATFPKVR